MATGEIPRAVFVNGVRICYAASGEGRPVLLAHGNGESHHLFDSLIPRLAAAGYRVIAPDSRGHGASESQREFHYADMAEDLYQLILALGLEKPAFYGHSDGGILGLMLETAHPGTLSALAASGVNLSPKGLTPAFVEACEERNRQSPDPLIDLMLHEPDISPAALGAIRCPVLLTAGEHDVIRLSETLQIAAAIPQAQTVIVTGADHGSYVTGEGAMGSLLLRFLEQPLPGSITLAAEVANIGIVTDYLDMALERLDCPPGQVARINVAVDEVCVNIASYAYAPEKGDMTIQLGFEPAERTVELTFIDSGIPFDPLQSADPDTTSPARERAIGGLGIFLVKKTMDGMAYRREDGRNILRVRKRI